MAPDMGGVKGIMLGVYNWLGSFIKNVLPAMLEESGLTGKYLLYMA